tara:strand:- start:1275 stop:1505 length:231 start_codon:yes stop_codon:yes gene_type:complete
MLTLQPYKEITIKLDFIDYKTNIKKTCKIIGLVCDLLNYNDNTGNYDAQPDFYYIKFLASKQINIDNMKLLNYKLK